MKEEWLAFAARTLGIGTTTLGRPVLLRLFGFAYTKKIKGCNDDEQGKGNDDEGIHEIISPYTARVRENFAGFRVRDPESGTVNVRNPGTWNSLRIRVPIYGERHGVKDEMGTAIKVCRNFEPFDIFS